MFINQYGGSVHSMNNNYLIKIIDSFDQYRVVNLLYLSTFSLFNFINICHTKGGITVLKNKK